MFYCLKKKKMVWNPSCNQSLDSDKPNCFFCESKEISIVLANKGLNTGVDMF